MTISIEVERREGLPVVHVSGEIDLRTAPELRQTLAELLEDGAEGIVLDLDAVEFLDSTALSVMVGVHKRLVRNGVGPLTIVCTSDPVLRVLNVTGLARVFTVHDSLDAAFAPR